MAYSPYFGATDEYAFFYNNHTYLTAVETDRSCYCLARIPPNRDDICCFFSGTSCAGPFVVQIVSYITDCMMSHFDFVNNSDSSGYFRLYLSSVTATLKNSVISFVSPSPKFI